MKYLHKIAQNTIFKFDIFYKTCFTLKLKIKAVNLKLCSKFEADISKTEDFVWVQYQMFPLDEIHFPLISNAVIFDHDFFQDHLTFLNHDFHNKCQNLYQVCTIQMK